MYIKGVHLHRADGSVDEYIFPVAEDENTGGNTGTGGESGDSGIVNPDILYVYQSGESEFKNCSYSVGTNTTAKFPPFEETNIFEATVTTITDCALFKYTSNDSFPSSISYGANIVLNTTFAEYSKLYIEARIETGTGASGYTKVGYFNKDEVVDDDDIFYDTGYVGQAVTGTKTVYEFDISALSVSKTISFLLRSGCGLYVYNIWLEK